MSDLHIYTYSSPKWFKAVENSHKNKRRAYRNLNSKLKKISSPPICQHFQSEKTKDWLKGKIFYALRSLFMNSWIQIDFFHFKDLDSLAYLTMEFIAFV